MSNRMLRFILFSLAGKVIGDLASKKNVTRTNKKNLPSFKGVLEIKHSMEGRIRFYIPILKNNNEAKTILEGQLSKVPDIKKIEANLITGSLLVVFNDKAVEPAILIGVVIKLLGLNVEVDKRPEAVATREMRNIKESLNMAIYEKSNGLLDSKSIFVLLSLFGGYRMIKANPTALPNGYTLLKWGNNAL